ncbi:hypothetical protein KDA_53590 [Dictyobacter alpinus]|uniref:Uncharacterized protein n=1 Tax=Dictyobacter alpinus TaxID=2014873 RepID=A0A402BET1_9CHLR|nr:hypothetical protein KDA_53590 [Dictyobacter alpinus]
MEWSLLHTYLATSWYPGYLIIGALLMAGRGQARLARLVVSAALWQSQHRRRNTVCA